MERVFGAVNVMSFSSHFTKKRTNKPTNARKEKIPFRIMGQIAGWYNSAWFP